MKRFEDPVVEVVSPVELPIDPNNQPEQSTRRLSLENLWRLLPRRISR
jgi:hypothetical protein